MTSDPLVCTLRYRTATQARIRSEYDFLNQLDGQLAKELRQRGVTSLTVNGWRIRLVTPKMVGKSPSQRKKWRAAYPSTASELKIERCAA